MPSLGLPASTDDSVEHNVGVALVEAAVIHLRAILDLEVHDALEVLMLRVVPMSERLHKDNDLRYHEVTLCSPPLSPP